MTLLDIKQIVRDRINQLPVHIWNSANNQVQTRCPYCGDSRNRLHGHFSIKIDTNSDSIIVFRCFRCNESGILTSQVMEDIGASLSIEDAKALDALNRPSNKSTYARQRPLNYKVPVIINPIDNKIKLDYLNNRLGIEFTSEMIQESKIILSIMDFFTENKIKIPAGTELVSVKYATAKTVELHLKHLYKINESEFSSILIEKWPCKIFLESPHLQHLVVT